MKATHAINYLPVITSDVIFSPESRFGEFAYRRIVGANVILRRGCSQMWLHDLRIEGGSLIIEGLNWHSTFERIWVSDAPGDAGIRANDVRDPGGPYPNMVCNSLAFRSCFASGGNGWGWVMLGHVGLTLENCAADNNAMGGFHLSSVHGEMVNCSVESERGDAILAWDSEMALRSFARNNARPLNFIGGSKMTVNGLRAL